VDTSATEEITVLLGVEVLILFIYIQSESVNVSAGVDYIHN